MALDENTIERSKRRAAAPTLIGGICELTLQAFDLAGLERFYRHGFDCSSVALPTGRRMSMAGAATAPRCFHRNARLVANAVAHANTRPIQRRPRRLGDAAVDPCPIAPT